MYHSTSGKVGYFSFFVPTDFKIDKELLKKILIREDELRYSEEVINFIDGFDTNSIFSTKRNTTKRIVWFGLEMLLRNFNGKHLKSMV